MFENYRIICVTPAGRERYLKILASYILKCPLVDEYHIWKNSTNASDVAYMYALEQSSPKVRVIEPPTVPPDTSAAIGQFFVHCVDENSIYIRFDDDIVYLEPNFFVKFLTFRVENPHYFLVFPNIVNNAICAYLQAEYGAFEPGCRLQPYYREFSAWGSGRFAEQLHRTFLRSAREGKMADWCFGPKLLALCRISVNCMSWFGKDFAQFGGIVGENEEEFLSVVKSSQMMRPNCINGDVLVSHFAFYRQRPYLDSTNVLDEYVDLQQDHSHSTAAQSGSPANKNIWIQRLLCVIENLRLAQEQDLRDADFLAEQIRFAGLTVDKRLYYSYGSECKYFNAGNCGLWQLPIQLAQCLVQLSKYKIREVIEIGTGSGWTTSFMAAYLLRFNRDLRVTSVDIEDHFETFDAVKHLLPIDFQVGRTSGDFADQVFDLAFIDGVHSYEGCEKDYRAVGMRASVCAFHDINDTFVAKEERNHGGVPRFWRELKSQTNSSSQIFEFLDGPGHISTPMMGIGLIVRNDVSLGSERAV
ncbi:MAG TPA: class I SAM-dependent methyltransferase [Candidatus Limnocylindria bacterium]|nr:class I SAM-dependent methyltransferase [Candidatus Limnocylindria bacterium]